MVRQGVSSRSSCKKNMCLPSDSHKAVLSHGGSQVALWDHFLQDTAAIHKYCTLQLLPNTLLPICLCRILIQCEKWGVKKISIQTMEIILSKLILLIYLCIWFPNICMFLKKRRSFLVSVTQATVNVGYS